MQGLVNEVIRRLGVLAPRPPLPDLQEFFQEPLGAIQVPGAGGTPIMAVQGYDPDNLVGISERFLGRAEDYTAAYTHPKSSLSVVERALQRHAIDLAQIDTVLDLGSGHGANTVLPLHTLKPSLRIVATDISLPLLATLSRLLDSHPQRHLVDIVAWDCMSGGLSPGRFDLVTGASLLHHLTDPAAALRTASQALRPGGYAIFVDPFDGAGLVRGLYETLLIADRGQNDRLSDTAVTALRALSLDYEVRLRGRRPADFVELEDKWIFSPEWMTEEGRMAGFGSVDVFPNRDHPGMYGDYVRTQLRLAAGPSAAQLPAWADDLMQSFDASMTANARRQMMIEGIVVMRK